MVRIYLPSGRLPSTPVSKYPYLQGIGDSFRLRLPQAWRRTDEIAQDDDAATDDIGRSRGRHYGDSASVSKARILPDSNQVADNADRARRGADREISQDRKRD